MFQKSKAMKTIRTLLLILGMMVSCNLHAQVSCTATAPSKVGINQAIQYSVKLSEKASQIASQNFGAFTKINGPSQSYSSSTSIINGQVSSSTEYTYTYTLQPTKLGQQTIPGVTFMVNGKQVKSNAVTITVTQENQQAQQQRRSRMPSFYDEPAQPQSVGSNEMMLKAFASTTTPYQGEEVIITHKLYIGAGIHNFQPTNNNFPSQPDLWTYTLGDPNKETPHTTEVVNGKRYDVFEIRKTSVYPQKSGKIVITPLELEGMAVIPYGFFGRQEKKSVKSNSVTLQVKPLPTAGKPVGFSGLVGKFTMKSTLTKTDLSTNDATDLMVTISGSGNLQHVENLNYTFPSDFDVADPAINDKINTGGSHVTGSRTFDYVIIPRTAGKFTIPSVTFSYFDIGSKTYKTLTTEAYNITVKKGNGDNNITNSSFQKDIQMLDKDIRYIKDDANAFSPKTRSLTGTPLYIILLLAPLFLFILFFIIWRKQIENRKNAAQLRNRRANKIATKRLKKAHKLLLNGKEAEFYIEISQALWGYVGDKFHIQQADLSMDNVRNTLKNKEVADENVEQFINTLNECEFARFSPNSGTELMEHLYNSSIEFITKIEKK